MWSCCYGPLFVCWDLGDFLPFEIGGMIGMKGIPTLKSFGRIEWKPNFWNDFLPTIS